MHARRVNQSKSKGDLSYYGVLRRSTRECIEGSRIGVFSRPTPGPKCLTAFQFAGLLNFAATQGHGSRTCVDVDLVVMNEATFASRNRRL